MYQDVIGIIGGMGSYATLSFFERVLDTFPAEKEWDRPRIIIDNRCNMPSRVRAILYQENVEQLIDELTDSVKNLLNADANKIILACNTSHYFLPAIIERVPDAKNKVINMINCTVDTVLASYHTTNVSLLASEGTIDSKIYHAPFEKRGIEVFTPNGDDYLLQRKIIEAVKQHKTTNMEKEMLAKLITEAKSEIVILGCTEFPVVYRQLEQSELKGKIIIDPLQCVLDAIAANAK